MCIYCGTNKYRKIYENHYGPIPKDESGRTYDIHHIDGNRSNNVPVNLKCVSIQDHYDIHYAQSDWGACLKIGSKMKLTHYELSNIAKLNAQRRLQEGTHPFSGDRNPVYQQIKDGTHPFFDGERSRKTQKRLVSEGKHHLLSGEIQRKANKTRIENGTHNFLGPELNNKRMSEGTHHCTRRSDGSSLTSDRVSEGTHHWLGPESNLKRILEGNHNFIGPAAPSQLSWECSHCGKKGKGKGNYTRAHGIKCKLFNNKDK